MSSATEGGYLPDSPFPGIESFTYAHRNVFFAREGEARTLLRLVVIYRGVLLYSESGVGKSSLVNAGLVPRIIAEGYQPERIRVQPKKGEEMIVERLSVEANGEAKCLPTLFAGNGQEQDVALSLEEFMQTLRQKAGSVRPVLIFDQFEEWTTHFEEGHSEHSASELRQMQQAILEALVTLLNDRQLPVKLLIILREDYLAQLTPLFERCPTLVDQYLRLTPLGGKQVYRTIRGPFDDFPSHYEPEISADLASTIRGQFEERSEGADIRLTEVQIVCRSLFESKEQGSSPDQKFSGHKDVQGLLVEYLEDALASLPMLQQEPAVVLLTRMVTSAGTRKRISHEDLRDQTKHDGFSPDTEEEALNNLVDGAKLVRRESLRNVRYYEIASEFLVSWIQEQAEAQRLRNAREKAALGAKQQAEQEARRLQEARDKDAAEALAEAEKAAQERELAQAKKSRNLLALLATALAIACLIAVGAAGLAFLLKGEAETSESHAEEQLQVAQESLAALADILEAQLSTATDTPTPTPGTPTPTRAGVPSYTPTPAPAEPSIPTADAGATVIAQETLEAQLASVNATQTAVAPSATPTLAGVPSATPTLEPTATSTPTVDTRATETAKASATQTAVAQCPFPPDGEFSQIWKADEIRSRLGCPKERSPVQSWSAEQPFKRGYMYWSETPDLFIVTIGNDTGAWHQFRTEVPWPYNPEPSCPAQPPPGLYQPISGFGRLWCENPDIREEIGFATAPEVGVEGNVLQEFERGFMLRESNDSIYLLFGDRGDYVRDMVFVPGGQFFMGSPEGQGQADERPQSSVTVSEFWLDRFEVTNAKYRACVAAGVCGLPHREDGALQVHSATRVNYYTDPRFDHFPVTFVSWSDARTYCRWSGKRLPTEAEWEWAAKGPTVTPYPWDDEAATPDLANYGGDTWAGDTSRVGMYPPTGYGLYDMAGNVWEWTSSLYVPYPYVPDDGRESPIAAGKRVLRGGSWRDGPESLRTANRDAGTEPDFPLDNVGFRCARPAE